MPINSTHSKMVKLEGILVSEEVCQIAGPSIAILRLFGILPLVINKTGKRVYFQPSLFYLVYSFGFGTVIIYLTYAGLLEDVNAEDEKSVKAKKKSDAFVTSVGITLVVLATICGIFLTPLKYSSFRNFIQCLARVDTYIPIINPSYWRRKSIIVLSTVLGTTFTVLLAEMLMYFSTVGESSGKMFIFKLYAPFYIVCHVLMAIQYMFWFFVNAILRRAMGLNDLLEIENIKKLLRTPATAAALKRKRLDNLYLFKGHQEDIGSVDIHENSKHIYKIMDVYLELCDAITFFNSMFGVTAAAMILSILWHLIEAPYWFIIELWGDRKSPEFMATMAAWCFLHLGRLALLTQPCQACLHEAQRTNDLVCKLIGSTDISVQYKTQLKDFARTLVHRPFEFNAAGLSVINVALITSIVGAITTYLVILIQFATEKETTNPFNINLN